MHTQRYGTGSHIVYVGLHGWGGSHTTYAPLAPHLPPDASLFALDLPGFGWSPRPRAWSAEQIAAECAEAIESLEIDVSEMTLLGNCSGAIVALLVAQTLGTRVSRLVLIDPFAWLPWYFSVFIHPVWGKPAYYSTFANPIGRWITNLSLQRRRTADTHLTDSFARLDHVASLEYLRALHALGDVERFRSVRVPVQVLYGERTFRAVIESLDRWRDLWPSVITHQIRGAGHLPLEEAPAQVAHLVFAAAETRRSETPVSAAPL